MTIEQRRFSYEASDSTPEGSLSIFGYCVSSVLLYNFSLRAQIYSYLYYIILIERKLPLEKAFDSRVGFDRSLMAQDTVGSSD